MNRRRAKFDRKGYLAMVPECFGLDFFFFEPEARAPFELVGDVAVVTIEGSLTHHDDWWCDSYDGILERVRAACGAAEAKSILLVIDSPGGEASGCFETAREIRAAAVAAGKPLASYVEGYGASGGYALAASATAGIGVSETAMVGSIGVIATLVDVTAMDAMFGLKFTIITSGARKADGNAHMPLSDDAKAAVTTNIEALAELFFGWVGDARSSAGLSADAARGLEAGVFVGAGAVERKLADEVTTRNAMLRALSSSTSSGAATKSQPGRVSAISGEKAMGWKDDMKKAAAEGDEEAKRCLAELDEKDEPEKKDDGEKKDEKTEEPKKDEKADSKDRDAPEKKEGEGDGDKEKKEEAVAAATRAKASAVIDASVEAAVAERMRPIELKAALDERLKKDPHMPKAFREHCMTLASAKELAALLNVTPIFGAVRNETPTQGQHVDESRSDLLQGEERAKLDEAMGVTRPGSVKMPGVDADGVFRLHVVKPTDLRNHLRAQGATKGK